MNVSPTLQEYGRNPDAKRLDRIRAGVEHLPAKMSFAVSGGVWTLQWPDPATGEVETLATFEDLAPRETMERLATAGDDIRFLLHLVDRAKKKIRELKAKNPETRGRHRDLRERQRIARDGADYAANCAMLCNEPDFARFLESMHGIEYDADREFLVGKVKQILEIGSRRELNTDHGAAVRWLDLVDDFNRWRSAQ